MDKKSQVYNVVNYRLRYSFFPFIAVKIKSIMKIIQSQNPHSDSRKTQYLEKM